MYLTKWVFFLPTDDNSIKYYFYLAFENSICTDYISEKFWRNFNQPVIPVVMGGGNYLRDAPPNSYIDVNDFSTVEELANYLKSLQNDRVSNIIILHILLLQIFGP